MGTDGLFDNLFNSDIVAALSSDLQADRSIDTEAKARKLAEDAEYHANDS